MVLAMKLIRHFVPAVWLILIPALGGCFHASITVVESDQIQTDENTAVTPLRDDHIVVDRGCGVPQKMSMQFLWGAPTKIEVAEDGREIWRYRRGLRWAGLSLFIAVGIIPIPLPLAVPVGFREYDFTVVNGDIQHVRVMLSKYGPSIGFHIGLTFDESGNTLNSAWLGKHPFWDGHEFLGELDGHSSVHECFILPPKHTSAHITETNIGR